MIQSEQQKLSRQKKRSNSGEQPDQLTFLEHFYELRKRVFWVVLILMLTSAAGFQLKDQLIAVIMAPLHGQKLIYLTPTGGFSFIFTLCIYFGALCTIPAAVYHTYRFLQPLLGKPSRRLVAGFMLVSTLLAAAGAAFGYFVTVPAAINFLSTFAGKAVVPTLTADSYLGFVVAYVLGLAALFQLPLLLFIFDHVHPFKPGTLSSTQNYVIIGAAVIAAVITPTPDAFNMGIVAVPIVLIYEAGAIAVYAHRKLKKARDVEVAAVPVFDDEPLTAVLNELQSLSELGGEDMAAPAADPAVEPAVTLPPLPAKRPSAGNVDGFSLRPRQIPPQPAAPVRTAPRPVWPVTSRPLPRSLDGML